MSKEGMQRAAQKAKDRRIAGLPEPVYGPMPRLLPSGIISAFKTEEDRQDYLAYIEQHKAAMPF